MSWDAIAFLFDYYPQISPQTKATVTKVITPIIEDADTLLYVINYSGAEGWVIASADKRTNAIVAMSEKGNFNYQTALANKGLTAWLDNVKSRMKYLKNHPEYVPDSSLVQLWTPNAPMTKGGGDDHEGEWLQLVYTMNVPQVRYSIDHLMDTHWGQGYPWNTCVPFDGNGNRCQTGSGPTALAQLAYYWRKPSTTYAYGTCTTNYIQTSNLELFNASASVWNTMPLDSASGTSSGYQAVAALMADIGASTQSVYLPNKTVSATSDCGTYLVGKGYSLTGYSFDNERVLSSILADRPVFSSIVSGTDTEYAIVDGIMVYAENTTYYYQWMPIGTYPPIEPEFPDLDHPENYVISVIWGDNLYYFHRVNWGYDGLYDDAWYSYSQNNPYWQGQSYPSYSYYQIH